MTQIKLAQQYPALRLINDSKQALVISDLHLGWEKLLSQRGIHIPSQTFKIQNMLLELLRKYNPTNLILLGDIKDAITKVEMDERQNISNFFIEIEDKVQNIHVVLGNHDGNLKSLLPKSIKIIPATGLKFGDVGLFHGHAWPSPELLECKTLITGHIHPTISIRDPMGFIIIRQVLARTDCSAIQLAKSLLKYLNKKVKNDISEVLRKQFQIELNVSQLFILPSFNKFLGGLNINKFTDRKKGKKSFIGPIFRSGCFNIENIELYLLDGTFLGTINELKELG